MSSSVNSEYEEYDHHVHVHEKSVNRGLQWTPLSREGNNNRSWQGVKKIVVGNNKVHEHENGVILKTVKEVTEERRLSKNDEVIKPIVGKISSKLKSKDNKK